MYEYLGNLRMVGTFSFPYGCHQQRDKKFASEKRSFFVISRFSRIIVEIYMINNSKDLHKR